MVDHGARRILDVVGDVGLRKTRRSGANAARHRDETPLDDLCEGKLVGAALFRIGGVIGQERLASLAEIGLVAVEPAGLENALLCGRAIPCALLGEREIARSAAFPVVARANRMRHRNSLMDCRRELAMRAQRKTANFAHRDTVEHARRPFTDRAHVDSSVAGGDQSLRVAWDRNHRNLK